MREMLDWNQYGPPYSDEVEFDEKVDFWHECAKPSPDLISIHEFLSQRLDPSFVVPSNKLDQKRIGFGGLAPIHLACRHGNWMLVHMLIKASANVNHEDPVGRTPLVIAVTSTKKTRHRIMRILLRAGARPNARNKAGQDCLYFAIQRADVEAVQYCLRHNARVDPPTLHLLTSRPSHLLLSREKLEEARERIAEDMLMYKTLGDWVSILVLQWLRHREKFGYMTSEEIVFRLVTAAALLRRNSNAAQKTPSPVIHVTPTQEKRYLRDDTSGATDRSTTLTLEAQRGTSGLQEESELLSRSPDGWRRVKSGKWVYVAPRKFHAPLSTMETEPYSPPARERRMQIQRRTPTSPHGSGPAFPSPQPTDIGRLVASEYGAILKHEES